MPSLKTLEGAHKQKGRENGTRNLKNNEPNTVASNVLKKKEKRKRHSRTSTSALMINFQAKNKAVVQLKDLLI
jgi:hypothetical protein